MCVCVCVCGGAKKIIMVISKQKLEDLQSPKLLKTLESVIIAAKIRLKMNCTYYFTVINTMI